MIFIQPDEDPVLRPGWTSRPITWDVVEPRIRPMNLRDDTMDAMRYGPAGGSTFSELDMLRRRVMSMEDELRAVRRERDAIAERVLDLQGRQMIGYAPHTYSIDECATCAPEEQPTEYMRRRGWEFWKK